MSDFRLQFINRLKKVLGYEPYDKIDDETIEDVAALCNHAASTIERLRASKLKTDVQNTVLRNEAGLGAPRC